MFITGDPHKGKKDHFDWETFFAPQSAPTAVESKEAVHMLSRLRQHLREGEFRLTIALSKVMRGLMAEVEIEEAHILELGAATGLLARWLLHRCGGRALLVDNSPASYRAFRSLEQGNHPAITYLVQDIFSLNAAERFNLVCSFGLIEHFPDKAAVLEVHRKFVASGGVVIILVPLDSPLTRAFYEVFP
jgi:2-polyprenyl-3-methyl-5-hydroxy-6-metoxy-1,4-benzoquinol methylase